MEENRKNFDYAVQQEGMPSMEVEIITRRSDKENAELLQAFIECRKQQNFTQQNLADASGIARANVARFENGTYNPTLDTMRRLAAALGKKLEIRLVDKD